MGASGAIVDVISGGRVLTTYDLTGRPAAKDVTFGTFVAPAEGGRVYLAASDAFRIEVRSVTSPAPSPERTWSGPQQFVFTPAVAGPTGAPDPAFAGVVPGMPDFTGYDAGLLKAIRKELVERKDQESAGLSSFASSIDRRIAELQERAASGFPPVTQNDADQLVMSARDPWLSGYRITEATDQIAQIDALLGAGAKPKPHPEATANCVYDALVGSRKLCEGQFIEADRSVATSGILRFAIAAPDGQTTLKEAPIKPVPGQPTASAETMYTVTQPGLHLVHGYRVINGKPTAAAYVGNFTAFAG